MTRRNDELLTNEPDAYEVTYIYDGTHTVVEISVRDALGIARQLGVGRAKRRKGDTRNQALGESLALARALRDAADKTAEVCSKHYGMTP